MSPSIFLAVALVGALAGASHYEVYMTACEAGKCGPSNASRSFKVGIPPPSLPLYLSKITYSADHKLVRHEALTSIQKGMGYIDVDRQHGRALFATAGNNTIGNTLVDTYVIDINSSFSASSALNEPRLLIGDRSDLLAPCKNVTTNPSAPGGCIEISTFFGRWFGDEVLFSFLAWNARGDLSMAQGLAAVRADGTGARILTHDASVCPYGPCDGTRPAEVGFTDSCPTGLPGDRVLFMRSSGPSVNRLAILDVRSGNVTVLDQVPLVVETSGCPSVDARGERVLYMAESPCPPYQGCNHTYGFVDLSAPSVFVPGFEVKTVDSPNFQATDATTSCAYDDTSSETFSCLGSNAQHNFLLEMNVDLKTGLSDGEDDGSFQACMTASCYKAYVVEGAERNVGDLVVV